MLPASSHFLLSEKEYRQAWEEEKAKHKVYILKERERGPGFVPDYFIESTYRISTERPLVLDCSAEYVTDSENVTLPDYPATCSTESYSEITTSESLFVEAASKAVNNKLKDFEIDSETKALVKIVIDYTDEDYENLPADFHLSPVKAISVEFED
jgi:hypothetical protein